MDKETEYVEKLSAQIVEWDNQIERLTDQAKNAPDSGADPSRAIAALQKKRDEAAAKLQEVASPGKDAGEDLKEGTDRILGEVSDILRDTILKI